MNFRIFSTTIPAGIQYTLGDLITRETTPHTEPLPVAILPNGFIYGIVDAEHYLRDISMSGRKIKLDSRNDNQIHILFETEIHKLQLPFDEKLVQ